MRKEEKAHMGQVIRSETAPDKSSHQVNAAEALMGRKCGGGPTDVSHSLSGAGEVVTLNDAPAKSGRKAGSY